MCDTRSRVENVIAAQSGADDDFDAALQGFDWIEQIQFACDLEEEFGIPVNDSELAELKSVEEVALYIERVFVAA